MSSAKCVYVPVLEEEERTLLLRLLANAYRHEDAALRRAVMRKIHSANIVIVAEEKPEEKREEE